jgi:hypothetical protein
MLRLAAERPFLDKHEVMLRILGLSPIRRRFGRYEANNDERYRNNRKQLLDEFEAGGYCEHCPTTIGPTPAGGIYYPGAEAERARKKRESTRRVLNQSIHRLLARGLLIEGAYKYKPTITDAGVEWLKAHFRDFDADAAAAKRAQLDENFKAYMEAERIRVFGQMAMLRGRS